MDTLGSEVANHAEKSEREPTGGEQNKMEQGTIQPGYFDSSYRMQLQVGRQAWI
jgi:hypothetical protein